MRLSKPWCHNCCSIWSVLVPTPHLYAANIAGKQKRDSSENTIICHSILHTAGSQNHWWHRRLCCGVSVNQWRHEYMPLATKWWETALIGIGTYRTWCRIKVDVACGFIHRLSPDLSIHTDVTMATTVHLKVIRFPRSENYHYTQSTSKITSDPNFPMNDPTLFSPNSMPRMKSFVYWRCLTFFPYWTSPLRQE